MWWIPLAVAFITGPLMWLLARFDRRNTDQHARNMEVLDRIESKVDGVREDLSDHIQWHLEGEPKKSRKRSA